ncbi:hypothetical protein ACERNI_10830 [Camelimonas sp. ID_303_24]
MKKWSPIAYPGPGDTHVNADMSLGQRGSWPDGVGYQQMMDELCAVVDKSGMTLDGAASTQLAQAIRSQSLNYREAAGTANALTVALDPAVTDAPADGMVLRVLPSATNTGAATLNAGWGAMPIRYPGGGAIAAGELVSGVAVYLIYVGGVWQVVNPIKLFERQTPVRAKKTALFTPGYPLADIPAGSVLTEVMVITVSGTRYADILMYCGFKNNHASASVDCRGRVRVKDGATVVETSQYLGVVVAPNGIQSSVTVRHVAQNLDPAKAYTIQLVVDKGAAVGPLAVADPYLLALTE